jgi:peptidoglycan/xylan/chitin deacetylase (PgdA/CDA1 family)
LTEPTEPIEPTEPTKPARPARPAAATPEQIRRRRLVALSALAALLFVPVSFVVGCGHRATANAGVLHEVGSTPPSLAPKPAVSQASRDSAAISRTIARQPLLAVGSRRGRRIALTFDDGPGPYTAQIMNILARENAPATFFWLGLSAHDYPNASWSQLPKGDFVIGDHTQGHLNLTRRTPQQQAADIDDGATRLRWETHTRPQLFRPPYGLFDHTTLKLLASRKLLMVLWSVDSEDYLKPGGQAIVNNVVNGAKPGGIVLMHDGGGDRSQTVAALPAIIHQLRANHYTLVSIPELLADPPPLRQPRYSVPKG